MTPSFSKNLGPIKIGEIKERIKCKLVNINEDDFLNKFSNIQGLKKNQLSFINDNEYLNFNGNKEGALICSNSVHQKFKGPNPLIVVDDVHSAVAIISNLFYRSFTQDEIKILDKPKIGNNCNISDSAIIENGSVIGKNVQIESGCKIGYNCVIGDNAFIDSNTVVTNAIIAENVKIGRNVSLGQQGFGFAIKNKKNIQIYHFGRVILQAAVSIGSNCTIDRGSFRDTVIGENTYFDNLCHVAHNVVVGSNCVFAAMSGIAGSSCIGNNVMAGGQTGIAGHINIGNNVMIAAKSGVLNNIKADSTVMGHPAINKFRYIRKYKKNYA